MSQSFYTTSDQRVTTSSLGAPSDRQGAQPRTLSDRHRHMLSVESGISPEVIAQRGYWTAPTAADIPDGFADYQHQAWMFPILVIPQWNLAGRRFAYVLRPDHPRRGKDGRATKYESMPGAPVGFDVPPAMVPLLRDPSIPLHISEGSKKADSMASRGLLCVSLNGVYAFLYKRLVVSEMDEINLDGRTVRVVFDSDVMTKPGPADALARLSGACARRGARTERVILRDPANPTAPAGTAKVGIDDYFVRGGRPADLDTLAQPWQPVSRPVNMVEYQDPAARIADLERLVSALGRLIDNPDLSKHQKTLGHKYITLAHSAVSRGDVGPDGKPRIRASAVASDFRSKPKGKGAKLAVLNPDGTQPITRRDKVKGVLHELRDAGVIDFTLEATMRTAANGDRFADTDIVPTGETPTDDMIRLADYRKPGRKTYTWVDPCPHCGRTHSRTVKVTRSTYCGTAEDPGCGALIAETDTTLTVIATPAQDAPEPDAESGGHKKGDPRDTGYISSPPLPSSNSSGHKKGDPESGHAGPLWHPSSMIDHPGHGARASTADTCTTIGCRNPISPHRTYICDECAAVLEAAS